MPIPTPSQLAVEDAKVDVFQAHGPHSNYTGGIRPEERVGRRGAQILRWDLQRPEGGSCSRSPFLDSVMYKGIRALSMPTPRSVRHHTD
jgi:hypothetical protein